MGLAAGAVVLATPGMIPEFRAVIDSASLDTHIQVIEGGAERQISVQNGLAALPNDAEIVVIHDAARPFVSREAVEAAIQAATDCGAATVALPAVDTILQADNEAFLESTPSRELMWQCQTPQVFRRDVIVDAHARARKDGVMTTDDGSLVKHYGTPVKLIPGDPLNFKITTPADIAFAATVIERGLA
jgi:2-C-methyl-D-erythritol 4-phosphate cytidylyltransferase